MLTAIWITPPLAIARVGAATDPCAAFSWSPKNLSPAGSGKTGLHPEETLTLDAEGKVSATQPAEIAFKDDADSYRPVAPFFELHGRWQLDGVDSEGPITKDVLESNGIDLADVRWTVTVGNLKAYHFTLNEGDRVAASVTIAGDRTDRHELLGRSPTGQNIEPLVPSTPGLPMGSVQLAKIDDPAFPELRLRFYPPAGLVYGPKNLTQRIAEMDPDLALSDGRGGIVRPNAEWADFDLPAAQKIINPDARWSTLRLGEEGPAPLAGSDPRNAPGGLSASIVLVVVDPFDGPRASRVSLGLVDDVGDGIVACEIGELTARARVAVGPPDFSPMSRPFVSLQDGLADREKRTEIRDTTIPDAELEAIVADIFERALETSDLMNKDAQNDRSRLTNSADLPAPPPDFEANPRGTLWASSNAGATANPVPADIQQTDAMPVSFRGQRKHRRYNAVEYVRDRLMEEPDLIEKWIRPPRGDDPSFDRRMPALMRGSDGRPMHLTRRQYEMIRLWASRQ